MNRLEKIKKIQEEYPVGGDQWGRGVNEDDVDWMIEEIEKLKEENEVFIGVLEDCYMTLNYYANDENYTYQEREIKWGESITHFKQSEIEKDRGEKARKLLRLE